MQGNYVPTLRSLWVTLKFPLDLCYAVSWGHPLPYTVWKFTFCYMTSFLLIHSSDLLPALTFIGTWWNNCFQNHFFFFFFSGCGTVPPLHRWQTTLSLFFTLIFYFISRLSYHKITKALCNLPEERKWKKKSLTTFNMNVERTKKWDRSN